MSCSKLHLDSDNKPKVALSFVVPIIIVKGEKIPFWRNLVVEGAQEISSCFTILIDDA